MKPKPFNISGYMLPVAHGLCGYPLLKEQLGKSNRIVFRFYDDALPSESYGNRVKVCPGCGNMLYHKSKTSDRISKKERGIR